MVNFPNYNLDEDDGAFYEVGDHHFDYGADRYGEATERRSKALELDSKLSDEDRRHYEQNPHLFWELVERSFMRPLAPARVHPLPVQFENVDRLRVDFAVRGSDVSRSSYAAGLGVPSQPGGDFDGDTEVEGDFESASEKEVEPRRVVYRRVGGDGPRAVGARAAVPPPPPGWCPIFCGEVV